MFLERGFQESMARLKCIFAFCSLELLLLRVSTVCARDFGRLLIRNDTWLLPGIPQITTRRLPRLPNLVRSSSKSTSPRYAMIP
jgi:hypothetical protein